MAVTYLPYNGEELSRQIYAVFMAYKADTGVTLVLNEGHRTMARQAALVVEKGLYNPITNPTGAAWPSPFAPHIRTGRPDHAVDVLWQLWEQFRVWCAAQGIKVSRPMSSEPWHWEFERASLAKWFTNRGHAFIRRTLRPGVRHDDVKYARALLKKIGRLSKASGGKTYGPFMVKAVKTFQANNRLTPDGVIGPSTWAKLIAKAH